MSTILSTKILTPSQQELILNTGIGLVHYNILEIEQGETLSKLKSDAFIITSKNAVPALKGLKIQKPVFCVGEVTAALLQDYDVQIVAENGAQLAEHIVNHVPELSFDYLCGSHRREELPDLLKASKVKLKEHITYHSHEVSKSFDRTFARVLFYSPRGVLAFAKANKSKGIAICIGNTTAVAARKYFDKVIVATKPTVINTIITAIKSLKNDQE